jgi:hypothetical protein
MEEEPMDQGESTYGMSNVEYDLVVTLGNLLEGMEALQKYAQDAEQAGDQETATIFRTLRENNRSSVQQLRSALGRQMSAGS